MTTLTPIPVPMIDWFEIPVRDLNRAAAFYDTLLATTLRRETMPHAQLAVFAYGPSATGGCLMAGESAPEPSADGSLVYLHAAPSLAAVLARVEAAGGRIATPKVQLPGTWGALRMSLIRRGTGWGCMR